MPTLVICTTDELENESRYVERLRLDGVDAYVRDAAALVYAAQGAGLMRADEVWATRAAFETARLHYPQATMIGDLAHSSDGAAVLGLSTDSRGGEAGPTGSGASVSAKDGPTEFATDDVPGREAAPTPEPRKRARSRAER